MAGLTADRRNRMAQILLQDGSIKVGDMAEHFQVSTETIRKDIIYLEEQGIAEKNHGGAIAKIELTEHTLDEKEWEHPEEKKGIAIAAAAMVHDHDTVILDAGSTTNAVAKQLMLKKNLTIITNSVMTASILADSDNTVFLVGGRVRQSSRAVVGGWALKMMDSIHANIAFLGSDGFKNLKGPACVSYDEAAFKNKVLESSKRTYVVADSSKCSSASHFSYCRWENINGLIIDKNKKEIVKKMIGDKTELIFA